MAISQAANLKNGTNRFEKKVGGLNKPPTNSDPKDAAEPSAAEGITTENAAKQLSVGRDTVKRAKAVIANAVPDITEAVKRGEVSIAAPPKRMQAQRTEPLVYEEQRALTLSLRHSVAFAASLFRTIHPSPTSNGTRQTRTSRTERAVQTKKTVRGVNQYEVTGKIRLGSTLDILRLTRIMPLADCWRPFVVGIEHARQSRGCVRSSVARPNWRRVRPSPLLPLACRWCRTRA